MQLRETWGDYKGIVLSSFPKCTRPIWRTEIVGFCLRLVAVFLHEKKENMEDIMHQNDERDSSSNSSVEDSSPDNSDEEEEEEKVVSIVSLSFLARAEVDLLILFCSSLLYVVFLFPVSLNLLFLFFVGSFERR